MLNSTKLYTKTHKPIVHVYVFLTIRASQRDLNPFMMQTNDIAFNSILIVEQQNLVFQPKSKIIIFQKKKNRRPNHLCMRYENNSVHMSGNITIILVI